MLTTLGRTSSTKSAKVRGRPSAVVGGPPVWCVGGGSAGVADTLGDSSLDEVDVSGDDVWQASRSALVHKRIQTRWGRALGVMKGPLGASASVGSDEGEMMRGRTRGAGVSIPGDRRQALPRTFT